MFFENISEAPPDPVFGLLKTFRLDPRKEKVYLCVGVYQDEEGNKPIFKSVKKAKRLFVEANETANYLPFEGIEEFANAMGQIIFSPNLWEELKTRTYHAQTLGATGAMRVGCAFSFQHVTKTAYFSNPTWPNHDGILKELGMEAGEYPYLSKDIRLDFSKMMDFLTRVPEKSLIILQASNHNPTGFDLTFDQWKELSSLMLRRRLIPFFDLAYQGLGDGLNEDVYSIRLFAKEGHEMLVSMTCSKNFGLYCHRTGSLFILAEEPKRKEAIAAQVNKIIRTSYSNPPFYGAYIVSLIYKNLELRKLWENELEQMRMRLKGLRLKFVRMLNEKSYDKNFDFILQQKGMFSFLGITEKQAEKLREDFGVYLPQNGRMNFAGLNELNLDYITDSMLKVLQ